MFEHAKNISLFLVIGLICTLISEWLKSSFITQFLSNNLITLLIALVAINTTTLGVVLTKIREISDRLGGDFSDTAREMRVSIVEQVVLIVVTTITQILGSSDLIKSAYPPITIISSVVLISVFSYALYILYDTANSIFVILHFENENKKENDEKSKKTEEQPKK